MRIDVVMDLPPENEGHRMTVQAMEAAAAVGAPGSEVRVVRTDTIDDAYLAHLPDGVVLGPGSPYIDPAAAEAVITSARERGVPLVGT